MSTAWLIGYLVGGVIVLLVVVLLLLMIRGARDAATKAESILEALNQARDNTAPLWEVNNVNHAVERITEGAGAIRAHLADKGAGP
jgi:hypothetical protein